MIENGASCQNGIVQVIEKLDYSGNGSGDIYLGFSFQSFIQRG